MTEKKDIQAKLLKKFENGCGPGPISSGATAAMKDWTQKWLDGSRSPVEDWDKKRDKETWGAILLRTYHDIGKKSREIANRRPRPRSVGADAATDATIEKDDTEQAYKEAKQASTCPFCPEEP